MSTELQTRVKTKLKNFLNLDQPVEKIRDEDSLISLGLTSMGFVQWAVELENEFGFEFGEEDLYIRKFNSLGNLISFIGNKINEPG